MQCSSIIMITTLLVLLLPSHLSYYTITIITINHHDPHLAGHLSSSSLATASMQDKQYAITLAAMFVPPHLKNITGIIPSISIWNGICSTVVVLFAFFFWSSWSNLSHTGHCVPWPKNWFCHPKPVSAFPILEFKVVFIFFFCLLESKQNRVL